MVRYSLKKIIVVGTSLLIVLVLLGKEYPTSMFIDHGAAWLSYPLMWVQKKVMVPVTSTYERLVLWCRDRDQLLRDYTLIKDECERLRAEKIQDAGTALFYQDTREVVQFRERYGAPSASTDTNSYGKLVTILSYTITAREHSCIIDRGEAHGITTDMVVLYKNCLIGKVVEVFSWFSKVMLITDPSCKIAARAVASKVTGMYEGIGDTYRAQLTYIFDTSGDLEQKLQKNDLVISTGEGLIFPAGFGLGEIIDWQSQDYAYTLVIKPLIDIRDIRYGIVLSKSELLFLSEH